MYDIDELISKIKSGEVTKQNITFSDAFRLMQSQLRDCQDPTVQQMLLRMKAYHNMLDDLIDEIRGD